MQFNSWKVFFAFMLMTFSFCATDTRLEEIRRIPQKYRSVTFIIGSDKSSNKYYTNAAQFFRQHKTGTNNTVRITQASLIDILTHLNSIPEGEKWDKINIVSHGNSWTGLAIKIKQKGPRTTLESVLNAQSKGEIPILKTGIFDEQSHVILYACGLGLNEPLMHKLKEVFSADISPVLTSTKLFNIFAVGKKTSKHSLAFFYNSFYKPNRYLGKPNLVKQLEARYPDVDIDWLAALKRKLPKTQDQAFSYMYKIPISWTEVYETKADRPKLNGENQIINWVLNQPEFLNLVKEFDIPLNKYQWSVQYRNYTNEAGEVKPAMRIKGKTVVMSVLQQLVEPQTKETFVPNLTDERYFMTL